MADITIGQVVVEVDITATQNGVGYDLKPVLVVNGGGGGSGVQTVTGDIVDNTDPLNPNVDTPTIQQVLTAGNEISAITELIFKGQFGDTKLYGAAASLQIEGNVFYRQTINSNTISIDSSVLGINSSFDYSSYTFGNTNDRKIYAQRGYVDDNLPTPAEFISTDAGQTAVLGSDNKILVLKISGGVAKNYGNISGTYELDLNDFDSARAVLTGNTVLDVLASSLPAVGVIADVKLLDINSTTAETLEFPVAWKVKGTFLNDGTLNQIAIAFRNYPTDGLIVSVFINDLP